MAEIITTFNTNDKTLSVTMDGKKVANVSSVYFAKYGDVADAVIESVEFKEDDNFVKVTKIRASEEGVEITTEEKDPLTENLSKALFPKKYKNGV
jgi:hypothetical protein